MVLMRIIKERINNKNGTNEIRLSMRLTEKSAERKIKKVKSITGKSKGVLRSFVFPSMSIFTPHKTKETTVIISKRICLGKTKTSEVTVLKRNSFTDNYCCLFGF